MQMLGLAIIGLRLKFWLDNRTLNQDPGWPLNSDPSTAYALTPLAGTRSIWMLTLRMSRTRTSGASGE
jgi:hypothetical protein